MKRLIENNLKKEFVMLLILIILIIEFVYMLYLKNDVSKTIDENEDNRVLAANSQIMKLIGRIIICLNL